MSGIFNIVGEYRSGELLLLNAATGTTILTIGAAGTVTVGTAPTYTTSNVTTDRTIDADSTSDAEVADVLCTVIADLKAIGLFQ